MHSILLAFNKENVNSYLDRSCDICQGEGLLEDLKTFTILYMCSAFVLKAVCQAMLSQTEDKGLAEFATFCFSRLLNSSTIPEATQIFRAFCTILKTPKYTESVEESVRLLDSIIKKSKEKRPKRDIEEKNEKKESSRFTEYFQKVLEEASEQDTHDISEDNPYFCPGIISLLFKTFIEIFPMWSGLLLGDLKRHASSVKRQVTPTVMWRNGLGLSNTPSWVK